MTRKIMFLAMLFAALFFVIGCGDSGGSPDNGDGGIGTETPSGESGNDNENSTGNEGGSGETGGGNG